ncbi:MAG: quinone-dependent dihydroorotate dehydrogenase [Candidatus Pacebacteria bacterium]|nr:quinone-dependent dihydroorotate dehydrogenase [Candidatus Paceibacterota bacterium]
MDFWNLTRPALMALPPETAHNLGLKALHYGEPLLRQRQNYDAVLRCEFLGHDLPHPLGLAAGFDKNGQAFGAVLKLGAAAVELGSVTPLGQIGNPRPRLFRLTEDQAIINRMGFNNRGAAAMESIVTAWRRKPRATGMVGLSLASNSTSSDPIEDFVKLTRRFANLVDYLTFDISCPNSSNGKIFLQPPALLNLLEAINRLFKSSPNLPRPPLLAKLSPDLSDETMADIIAILVKAGIDGLILSNTSSERPAGLDSRWQGERGGLSGRPLFAASTRQLAAAHAELMRHQSGVRDFALIGVGGVFTGQDALDKIMAGASLVQLYSAMVYRGPQVFNLVAEELATLLRQQGFNSVKQALGQGLPSSF